MRKRQALTRRKDLRVFRRTAQSTRVANIASNNVMRGGVRL